MAFFLNNGPPSPSTFKAFFYLSASTLDFSNKYSKVVFAGVVSSFKTLRIRDLISFFSMRILSSSVGLAIRVFWEGGCGKLKRHLMSFSRHAFV